MVLTSALCSKHSLRQVPVWEVAKRFARYDAAEPWCTEAELHYVILAIFRSAPCRSRTA